METEFAIAYQYLVDMSQLREVVFDTLDDHHRLTAVIDGQCLILNAFRSHLYLWQLSDLGEYRVIGSHRLALGRHDFQLWVEAREEGGHQVVEAVEHG